MSKTPPWEELTPAERLAAILDDDSYVKRLKQDRAELLAALKYARRFLDGTQHDIVFVDDAIAKCEEQKP